MPWGLSPSLILGSSTTLLIVRMDLEIDGPRISLMCFPNAARMIPKYDTYLDQLGITYPTERAADGSCAGAATP